MRWLFPYLLSAVFAHASCPETQDDTDELLKVIEEARAAPDQSAGQAASGKMWRIWLRAPDASAQEMLDMGMSRRQSFDFLGALEDFDRLVAYCPNYAEGYNQRAFVNYLREDFASALKDLDKTLEMIPYHVGAQSGRALTLMRMGRRQEARLQMLDAVKNNPWLSERALLEKGAPLGPLGEDI